MFQLRNKEPEAVILPKELPDWEPKVVYPSEHELDALGHRLDHARKALDQTQPDTWARTYWQDLVNNLVRKWRRLLVETNIGVHRNLVSESWTINHDWIEGDPYGDNYGVMFHWWNERVSGHQLQEDLNRSWAVYQEARYQNALKGFV
jgi:hypothetical protein